MRCLYFIFALFLSGCTMGPTYVPPCDNLPEQWKNSLCAPEENSSENFIWWQSLNDPVLECLLDRASQQNLDLSLAYTRIQEARLELKGKKGEWLPHVDASLTGGHFYTANKHLLREVLGCSSGKKSVNFFEAGFDASWEIDLFGALKHEIAASQAKLEATEESYNDAWISLSAEVARNYIELRSLQQQRSLLLENIEAQKDSIHLNSELLSIGDSSSIDQLRAESQFIQLQSQKPSLELSIEKALLRLSILLGEMPSCVFDELSEPGNLPQLPCIQPLCIPSEILRRRPDIRKAERELASATELVGAAVASRYPRISITGFIGDISSQLKHLSNSSSLTWFAAPQLLFPLFNSRMLQQDVTFNQIKVEQALLNYQKVVLNAMEEVESSLASYRFELEKNGLLEKAFNKSMEAYELTQDLYKRGVNDYFSVLTANRAYLLAREALLQSNATLLMHYIALYKSLGGTYFCD